MDAPQRQQAYYTATAEAYDSAHLTETSPEHDFALSLLGGFAAERGYDSFLDVGAGTGRGMLHLKKCFPASQVCGVEPVAALREVALSKGIDPAALTVGDANQLNFGAQSFDCAMALGVMHHVAQPRRVYAEMLRVARRAVYISDLNNFGCGSFPQKCVAHVLRAGRLWRPFQFVKNGFKFDKYSEGDGVHYSYSLLDDVSYFRQQGWDTHLFATRACAGSSLLWGASHVALLALRRD